jgi:hypothetical protein
MSVTSNCAPNLEQFNYFCDDVPSPGTFSQELDFWHIHWARVLKEDRPCSALASLIAHKARQFPKIYNKFVDTGSHAIDK